MGVYWVRPGVPFVLQQAGKVFIAGDGDVMGDQDESTYVSSTTTGDPHTQGTVAAPLPAIPPALFSQEGLSDMFVSFAAKASPFFSELGVMVYTLDQWAERELLDIPESDTPHYFSIAVGTEITYDGYAKPLADDLKGDLIAGEAHLIFRAVPGFTFTNRTNTIYEFALGWSWPGPDLPEGQGNPPIGTGGGIVGGKAFRRVWPREHGRVWPPPRHQHGRRTHGGYL